MVRTLPGVIFLAVCVNLCMAARFENGDESSQLHLTGTGEADAVGERRHSCGTNGDAVPADKCGNCCLCAEDSKVEFIPSSGVTDDGYWIWLNTKCGTNT